MNLRLIGLEVPKVNLLVRKLTGWVAVWSRNREHAETYAREMVTGGGRDRRSEH